MVTEPFNVQSTEGWSWPHALVLLCFRCIITAPAIRNGTETLPTGDRRPTSLLQCTGTHSPCPTAVQTTRRAPTPTLGVIPIPSPPYFPTHHLVLWWRPHPWPTSCLPPSPPGLPCYSPPTTSPTQQASCIRSQWASTRDYYPPPPCTPRASSSPSFPRTPTSPRPPTPVSLSAPQK